MNKRIVVAMLGVAVVIVAGLGYGFMTNKNMNPSDVNSDGVVNLQDVSIVMSNMSAE